MITIENNLEKKFLELTGNSLQAYYLKYRPKLIWMLYKRTNNMVDAEMFADQAWHQALEKLDTYNPEKAAFSTWAFTIAKNIHSAEAKQKSKRQTSSLDQDFDGTSLKNIISDKITENGYIGPEQEANEEKAKIAKLAISKLPKKYRDVLMMRHINDMQYEHIAEELNKERLNTLFSKRPELVSIIENECEVKINEWIEAVASALHPYYLESEYREYHEMEAINPKIYKSLDILKKYGISWDEHLNYNLSTVKSQIRTGRKKLLELVEDDFKKIDEKFYFKIAAR